MRPIRRGDHGPAVTEIRSILVGAGLACSRLRPAVDCSTPPPSGPCGPSSRAAASSVDGEVGDETWRALDAARWQARRADPLPRVTEPLIGDDVRQLQERLLEMGYDVGRADGIYGARTARAVAAVPARGRAVPRTAPAARRPCTRCAGSAARWSAAAAAAARDRGVPPVRAQPGRHGSSSSTPGHGGTDPGVVVPDGPLRWTEADLAFDLASRLEGRLAAAGMRVHLTRGPAPAEAPTDLDRAALANDLGADLLISLHLDGHANPQADGVATYHYGTDNGVTSTDGGAAGRAGAARDRRAHRDAQLPDPRQDLGAAAADPDARRPGGGRLPDLAGRPGAADRPAVPRAGGRGDHRRRAADVLPGRSSDVPTGSIDVSELSAVRAVAGRRSRPR